MFKQINGGIKMGNIACVMAGGGGKPATRVLFLDDERNPEDVTWVSYPKHSDFTVVRTYKRALEAFVYQRWDMVSLDHDLQDYGGPGGREYTGYDVLKAMLQVVAYSPALRAAPAYPLFVFHTQNGVGKRNMECYYSNWCQHFD